MVTIEERFSSALHLTARLWRQALDRRLKHLGLSQASWMAIASIAKYRDEPKSQTELATQLGIEDPSMVAMIDRLVKAGYIARLPSATDRRVKLIVLTEAGAAVHRKVMAEAATFRMEMLASVDPEKLLGVTEFLEAMLAKVESSL